MCTNGSKEGVPGRGGVGALTAMALPLAAPKLVAAEGRAAAGTGCRRGSGPGGRGPPGPTKRFISMSIYSTGGVRRGQKCVSRRAA